MLFQFSAETFVSHISTEPGSALYGLRIFPIPTLPILLHKSCQKSMKENKIITNNSEVEIITQYIKCLEVDNIQHSEIQIISPLQTQIQKLKLALGNPRSIKFSSKVPKMLSKVNIISTVFSGTLAGKFTMALDIVSINLIIACNLSYDV